ALVARGLAASNGPTLGGRSTAFAIVELFARPSNVDANIPLGETVADANGHWSLTTGPLAPGSYLVTAKVTPPAGYPSLMMTLTSNNGTFFIGLSPTSTSSSTQ